MDLWASVIGYDKLSFIVTTEKNSETLSLDKFKKKSGLDASYHSTVKIALDLES